MTNLQDQIRKLEEQISELKANWPAHSPQPWMLEKLEDLEEKLEAFRKQESKNDAHQPTS